MAALEDADGAFCVVCGSVAETMCGKCKVEKYCSRECQVGHWKTHKPVCKKRTAASAPAPEREAEPSKPAGWDRTPLCGRGYLGWLAAQHGASHALESGPLRLERPQVGFQNQENTCYLNAVLQCLLHTTALREGLLQACPRPRREEEWLTELLQLFREVDEARGSRRSISASRIASLITQNKEFTRGKQADAHEALMLMFSRILADCLAVGDGSGRALKDADYATKEQLERTSLLGLVFGMDLGQRVQCDSCSYESTTTRVEYCCCLNVTLGMSELELQALRAELRQQQLGGSCHLSSSRETGAPDTTLPKLLEDYMKDEHIAEYKCEKCKRSGCTRTAYLAHRPNVLVVYIDRRQDAGLYGKINRKVRFAQRLDLAPHVRCGGDQGAGLKYSLYGIIVHRDVNRSTFFGHYVAYVRDKTSAWFLLDDTRVQEVPWSVVQELHAYILLYAAEEVVSLPSSRAPAPEPAQPSAPQRPSGSRAPAPAREQEREARPQPRQAPLAGSAASVASTRSTAASSASSPRSSSTNSTALTLAYAPSAAAAVTHDGSAFSLPAAAGSREAADDAAAEPAGEPEEAAEPSAADAGPGGEPSEAYVPPVEELLAQLDKEEALEAWKEESEKKGNMFDFDELDRLDEEKKVGG